MSWGHDNMKFAPMERTGFCRGCDKAMARGFMAIKMYSWRNRGQNIFFCPDCVDKMNNLVPKEKS